MNLEEMLKSNKVLSVSRSLLGAWFCVPESIPEEDALGQIWDMIQSSILEVPGGKKELLRDRLFGGFDCTEKHRRHVYFAQSCYTVINPELNKPLSDESRKNVWKILIEHNPRAFIGSKNFTQLAPSQIESNEGENAKQ
jgi:hypothetical protein